MNKRFIISIPTYKEAENIKQLIEEIIYHCNDTKILIINDDSKDNIKKILSNFGEKVEFINRPKKLGLGTAHILSMLYAIRNKYEFLITMDADFSHDHSYIPKMMGLATKDNFVIGSRFIEDGKSDYTGLRKYISSIGNLTARKVLGINCKELTTYFRIYSVEVLKKLPFYRLNIEGYSLGVRTIWLINKLKIKIIEFPIHFKDRNKGKSKIPKLQILTSALDLIYLKILDIFVNIKFYFEINSSYNLNIVCDNCNNNIFTKIKNNTFKCLACAKKTVK